MSRHATDHILLDPDSDWQDSAQSIVHATAPRVPRERAPMSLGYLLLAVVIVSLCAGYMLVSCYPTINAALTRRP